MLCCPTESAQEAILKWMIQTHDSFMDGSLPYGSDIFAFALCQ